MAKSAESARRRLRRSRNVSSFFEESTPPSPAKTTVNVIADVHNGAGERSSSRRQRDDDKKTKQRSSQSSKASSRARSGSASSKDLPKHGDDSMMTESLDLIEEFEASKKRNDESLEEKPRRRKQWNTATAVVANVTIETEAGDSASKRPQRKRWSKDAGVIRLPETSGDDDASPLIDVDSSRKTPPPPPVPAPRINLPSRSSRSDALLFDNPAFVSDNEADEVLRIETDHDRVISTKIEMRRMSEDEAGSPALRLSSGGGGGGSSARKHRWESTAAKSNERLAVDSDDHRSSKAKSSESSRRSSVGQSDESDDPERITRAADDHTRSSSRASEERGISSSSSSSSSRRRRRRRHRSKPRETTRVNHESSRRRERSSSLIEKRDAPPPPPPPLVVSSSARDASSAVVDPDARIRRQRKKKRKQEKEATKEEIKFISVTIHRADVLEADYVSVRRPMVRIHIVEARTGSYLKSGNTYLQPMITGKFDFKKNKSMIPVWEEELIFEHSFDAIMRREENERVVILFEVIELLNFADASLGYDKVGSEGCWNKIAWAFLKPVGINNIFYTDKKVRLQLYKPRQSFKKYGRQKCEVYTWWQSNNRDKYPSSLLVTVTSVPPPKLEPVLYQKLPMNDLFNDAQIDSRGVSKCTSESIGLPKWARLAAQSCKIPNETMFETEVSEKGCFYVAFSNDDRNRQDSCSISQPQDFRVLSKLVQRRSLPVVGVRGSNGTYLGCSQSNRAVCRDAAASFVCLLRQVRARQYDDRGDRMLRSSSTHLGERRQEVKETRTEPGAGRPRGFRQLHGFSKKW